MSDFPAQYLQTVTWRRLMVSLPVIIAGGMAPMLLGYAAEKTGDALGCVVNDGTAAPCALHGFDVKPLLSVLFDLGWASIVTLPLAIAAFALWQFAVFGRIVLLTRRRLGL